MQELGGGTLRPGGLELTREIVSLARLAPGTSLLDVGCGIGISVQALQGLGYQAQGIDISSELIHQGRQNGANIVLGDAYMLERCYDSLLYECTMSVLENRAAAISAAARVLNDEGKLLLADLYLLKGQCLSLPGLTCLNGVLPWTRMD